MRSFQISVCFWATSFQSEAVGLPPHNLEAQTSRKLHLPQTPIRLLHQLNARTGIRIDQPLDIERIKGIHVKPQLPALRDGELFI